MLMKTQRILIGVLAGMVVGASASQVLLLAGTLVAGILSDSAAVQSVVFATFTLFRSTDTLAWAEIHTEPSSRPCGSYAGTEPVAYSYTDTDVTPGTTYYYRLQYSGLGCGTPETTTLTLTAQAEATACSMMPPRCPAQSRSRCRVPWSKPTRTSSCSSMTLLASVRWGRLPGSGPVRSQPNPQAASAH